MEVEVEKGDRVILTDSCSQTFIGLVKSINKELGRIVLSDIIQHPDNIIVRGCRNFDSNEITELRRYVTENDVNEKDIKNEKEEEPPVCNSPELSETELERLKKLQSEYKFINDCSKDYYSAIESIRQCNKIGFCGFDTKKGRCTRASVIAISTPTNVFVFDVRLLGDNTLHKGLKCILESKTITKIVYDCRLLSDCLKYKHEIELENVRDVEAEDIMAVYQERKAIRRHTRPFNYLVKVYLGIKVDDISDSDAWVERPIPKHLLQGLVSMVSLLPVLHEAIERKYLQRLLDASHIYNTHLRDLDFYEFFQNDSLKTLKKKLSRLEAPVLKPRTGPLNSQNNNKTTDDNCQSKTAVDC